MKALRFHTEAERELAEAVAHQISRIAAGIERRVNLVRRLVG
jgi:hypothetical protein